MKALIIFTTEYLWPNDDVSHYFFNKRRTKKTIIGEKLSDENHSIDVYRLEDEAELNQGVYGCNPLIGIGANKVQDRFILYLLLAVLGDLNDKERNSLESIIMIMHRKELAESDRFKWLKEVQLEDGSFLHETLNQDKDLRDLLPKPLSIEESRTFQMNSAPSDSISIEFIAFSHDPDAHLVYDILCKHNQELVKPDELLGEYVHRRFEELARENTELKDLIPQPISQRALKSLKNFSCSFFEYVLEENSFESRELNLIFQLNNDELKSLNGPQDLCIIWVSHVNLRSEKFYDSLVDFSENQAKGPLGNGKSSFYIPKPFIILSEKDIMLHSAEKLDKRYRFLDSSIWFRYIPLELLENNSEGRLEDVLESISWASFHSLYRKNVTKEYWELNNRLLKNSYLSDNFGGGHGHATYIFPFTFHSETFMEHKAKEMQNQFNEIGQNTLSWNFLLVDDYANYSLKEREGKDSTSPDSSAFLTKANLVQGLICSPP